MHDEFTRNEARAIEPISLLRAYAAGIFPMGLEDGSIGWFSPEPRGIIPLDGFHIPKGLRRALKKNRFEIRYDTAFADVMRGCAARESTWIDQTIFDSYVQLHELGFAHSVEAWRNGELVGGLYGVALRGLFCGESMFSRETDASKICLVHLVERLRRGGFVVLDTQWTTPHLRTFGAVDIPRESYLDLLEEALETQAEW